MPAVNIVDSTWIGVRPGGVAAAVADAARWPQWWPDLDLEVAELRGDKGVRWTVRRAAVRWRAPLCGSMEVWLEPVLDGVVAHFFLRLDRIDGRPLGAARIRRESDRRRRAAKRLFWALADDLDAGRIARISGPPGL